MRVYGNMDRRSFLGGLGGLVAVSALPGCRTLAEPDVFAARGKWERLSIGMVKIDAGASAPFSILHISDTHLAAAYDRESEKKREISRIRTRTFGGHQEDALRDSLDWARKSVDYVLHTGDLIDFQSEANFDLVRRHFGVTMFGAVGNHEFSPEMWLTDPPATPTEAWKDRSRARLATVYPFDISLASTVVNGVNFITLDDVYGTVTEAQVARFAKEVEKGLPIVLCMHVPFYTDGLWLKTRRYWVGAEKRFRDAALPKPSGDRERQLNDRTTAEFIRYLKSERLLKGLLVGHEHITMQERFSETATQFVVGGNFMFHGQEVLFT